MSDGPIAPEDVERVFPPQGTLRGMADLRDHPNVGAVQLTADDFACTTDERLGCWMGYTMVASLPVDHGPVADAAAMLALHNWADDSRDTVYYHYVAPGDSCTRADDPRHRWHCLRGHGTALADWERRPLSSETDAIRADVATLDGRADELEADLSDRQPIASALTELSGLSTAELGRLSDLLSASPSVAGLNLLEVGTPSSASLPQINADGTISLISPGGGGGGGWYVDPAGPPVLDATYALDTPGDTNGLVYAIGTQFGAAAFSNPAQTSFASGTKIGTLRSSSSAGSALDATNRLAEDTHAYGAGSWWAWDFGAANAIKPSVYTIRNRNGDWYYLNIPRNWKLQGTNSVTEWTTSGIGSATWVDLDVRTGDTGIPATSGGWGTFTLTPPTTAYRFLRLLSTGLDSSGQDYFIFSEIEFYGEATPRGVTLPGWATCWLTNGAGVWVPGYESA